MGNIFDLITKLSAYNDATDIVKAQSKFSTLAAARGMSPEDRQFLVENAPQFNQPKSSFLGIPYGADPNVEMRNQVLNMPDPAIAREKKLMATYEPVLGKIFQSQLQGDPEVVKAMAAYSANPERFGNYTPEQFLNPTIAEQVLKGEAQYASHPQWPIVKDLATRGLGVRDKIKMMIGLQGLVPDKTIAKMTGLEGAGGVDSMGDLELKLASGKGTPEDWVNWKRFKESTREPRSATDTMAKQDLALFNTLPPEQRLEITMNRLTGGVDKQQRQMLQDSINAQKLAYTTQLTMLNAQKPDSSKLRFDPNYMSERDYSDAKSTLGYVPPPTDGSPDTLAPMRERVRAHEALLARHAQEVADWKKGYDGVNETIAELDRRLATVLSTPVGMSKLPPRGQKGTDVDPTRVIMDDQGKVIQGGLGGTFSLLPKEATTTTTIRPSVPPVTYSTPPAKGVKFAKGNLVKDGVGPDYSHITDGPSDNVTRKIINIKQIVDSVTD